MSAENETPAERGGAIDSQANRSAAARRGRESRDRGTSRWSLVVEWLLAGSMAVAAAVIGFYSVFWIWPPGDSPPDDAAAAGPEKTAPEAAASSAKTSPPEADSTSGASTRSASDTASGSATRSETDSMAGVPDPDSPIPATPEALFDEAARFVDSLEQSFPTSPDALEVKARFLDWRGKSKEAVACWERALLLNPKYAYAHLGLGTVAARNENHAEAIKQLRLAVEENPTHFESRMALAESLLAENRAVEAVPVLEEHLHRDPRPEGFFQLGQAYMQLREYAKAKDSFEAAIRLSPKYGHAHYRLGIVCSRLGQHDLARKHMELSRQYLAERREDERSVRRNYNHLAAIRQGVAQTYLNGARLYVTARRTAEAERLWRRAADLAPNDIESRQGLAWLRQQQGKFAEAIALLEQLAKIDPDNPSYRPEIERLRAAVAGK